MNTLRFSPTVSALHPGYSSAGRLLIPTLFALAIVISGCAPVAPAPQAAPFHAGPCEEARLITDHLAKLPGVSVVRAGSAYQVRLRGSLEEPLFIIDGLPLAPQPSGALRQAVNPCDVASIRVLSDPADLTYYGVRGANGVVLITTRRQ
jgi:TonB-dependent SusC/RagA subfamily outer membrane receptor